jgi:hypothetical protein
VSALIDTIATSEPTLDVTRLELAPNRGFTIARPMSRGADRTALLIVDRRPSRDRRRATFRVTKVSVTGATLFSREFSYQPIPVSEDVRQRIHDQIVDNIAASETQTPRARIEEAVRGALTLPAFHPPVSAVVPGGDGTIWIRREDAGVPSVSWDVSPQPATQLVP